MFYERHYTDRELKLKYISSNIYTDMLRVIRKNKKSLYKDRDKGIITDEEFEAEMFFYTNDGESGVEFYDPYPADCKIHTTGSLYFNLYFQEHGSTYGVNHWANWLSEANRGLCSHESLYYRLDYVEYAYKQAVALAEKRTKKRKEAFWKKLGF